MAKKKHKTPEENARLALQAQDLLKAGVVKTIGEAIAKVGINYAAYNKYKKKRGAKPIPESIDFQEINVFNKPGKTLIVITEDTKAAEAIIGKFIGG